MNNGLKILFLFLLVNTFTIRVFAQTPASLIKEFTLEVQRINTDKGLKKIELSKEEFANNSFDGSGNLIAYTNGRDVRKIVVFVGKSNGNEVIDLYIKKGVLFFAYTRFIGFKYNDHTNMFDYANTFLMYEGRLYYQNDKILRIKEKGGNGYVESPDAYPSFVKGFIVSILKKIGVR
ncbi:MAG: hypothetical protein H0X33_02965 [Taibaiella sp.]|nr:hypothetical protein [Taibaiella sp.]